MSNIPISSLPVTPSLDGSEIVPIVQGGTTKRTTTAAIAGLASSGAGSAFSFVFATDESLFFPGSRLLAAQAGVTTLTDGGAASTLTVGVAANGIGNTQIRKGGALSVIGNSTNSLANVADIVGTASQVLRVNTAGTALGFGAIDLTQSATVGSSVLGPANGGTGILNLPGSTLTLGGALTTVGAFGSTFTMTGVTNVTFPTSGTLATTAGPALPAVVQGDLLYGSATNVLSALAKNTTATRYLANTGASNNPAWSQVDLTTGVTGTLPATSGGTAQSTYATGDTLYASAANTLSKLTGNITTAKQYLSQTGSGAASAAPAWATITGADITGAALTAANDTNVTLTLGGTPATALLRAASVTAGWTGQLAVGRGGTGLASGTSGGILGFTGTTTLASSVLLTQNALVLGGGAAATPTPLASLGTTTTVLHGNAAGAPTFGSVVISTDVSGLGTGVATALGVNVGTAGSFIVNGGALGSPSSIGTLPAFTLGGTISGGGNQINNVIIGTTTPLAGSFTTVSASTSMTSPIRYGGSAAGSSNTIASTSGAGTTDFIAFQTGSQVERMRIGTSGLVGIGTNNPQSILHVNTNAVQNTSPIVPTLGLYISGKDSDALSGLAIDAFGTSIPFMQGRSARGTAASKTATQANDPLLLFAGSGYQTTTNAYTAGVGSVRIWAGESFTSAANGAYVTVETTPNGTTTTAEAARFFGSKGFAVGLTTDPGANCISSSTVATSAPVTLTGTSGTVTALQSSIIFNPSGTFTVTLPAASSFTGRWLYLKTIAAQIVNSASSNVVPIASASAGTAIFPSASGKFTALQSDGTNWIMMTGN